MTHVILGKLYTCSGLQFPLLIQLIWFLGGLNEFVCVYILLCHLERCLACPKSYLSTQRVLSTYECFLSSSSSPSSSGLPVSNLDQLDVTPLCLAAASAAAESLQSCLTLSDPMDCSLPGSSVHGSFQARVLEWVAIAFSLYLANCIKFEFCLLFLLLREKHGIEIIHSITTVKASFHNEKR